MANNCTCETISVTEEGLCTTCKKLVPWSKLKQSSNEVERVPDYISESPLSSTTAVSPRSQLEKATEKVVRIASIFDQIGTVLNGINYGLAFILVCASFLIGTSSSNGGVVLAVGLLISALVWLAGWVQVAILRGLSAYFLMKGLAQQKSMNT